MKQIIDGKLYNTKTATFLGEYQYSNSRDFHFLYEALYKTKKGTYFLYGEGGPLSKYVKASGNNSYGGSSEITLMSEKEAKEWAEENISADEYLDIFGELEEG